MYGVVGYPMVMTVVSGIEVLGALTSKTTFRQGNGAARFGEFWKQYMYAHRPAFQRLDSVVYEFIRHPLAHSFMTKPMIVVTKERDEGHLCQRSDGVIHVDALTLTDDFSAAYRQRLRPNIVGQFKTNMESRFAELRDAFWQEHEAKQHELAKVPPRPTAFRLYEASDKPMEQTGVRGLYSTNVSTPGFDNSK